MISQTMLSGIFHFMCMQLCISQILPFNVSEDQRIYFKKYILKKSEIFVSQVKKMFSYTFHSRSYVMRKYHL